MSYLIDALIDGSFAFLLVFGEPIANRIRARKGQQ